MYMAEGGNARAGGALLGVTKELLQQLPSLKYVEFQARRFFNGGDCWSDEAGPSGGRRKYLSVMALPEISDSEITLHAFALIQRPASDRLFPQVVIIFCRIIVLIYVHGCTCVVIRGYGHTCIVFNIMITASG